MMRAKLEVGEVQDYEGRETTVVMHAVGPNKLYPDDGSDEDNTYAKFSPMAEFKIVIANPALFGKFYIGQRFYVDFTEVTKEL